MQKPIFPCKVWNKTTRCQEVFLCWYKKGFSVFSLSWSPWNYPLKTPMPSRRYYYQHKNSNFVKNQKVPHLATARSVSFILFLICWIQILNMGKINKRRKKLNLSKTREQYMLLWFLLRNNIIGVFNFTFLYRLRSYIINIINMLIRQYVNTVNMFEDDRGW